MPDPQLKSLVGADAADDAEEKKVTVRAMAKCRIFSQRHAKCRALTQHTPDAARLTSLTN